MNERAANVPIRSFVKAEEGKGIVTQEQHARQRAFPIKRFSAQFPIRLLWGTLRVGAGYFEALKTVQAPDSKSRR